MAELVAAFGSSHSPALNSPAGDMAGHARRDELYAHHLDREGRRVSYPELLRSAPPGMENQIAPEELQRRIAACEAAIGRLRESIAAARLDALVVVGDDQHEQYFEENMPAFLVYCGARIANAPLDLPEGAPAYWRRARSQYHEPDAAREYPVAAELGLHVVSALIEREFDVSFGKTLPRPRGEGHAFGFVHRRLLAEPPLPILPVVVNTYYPPNQPRPARCFALGRAIRMAIGEWKKDERVGILASGGLSHFTVDEDLDRRVLEACRSADEAAFAALPLAKLESGSSEIRNWIVAAGAAEKLATAWQEYVPLYRTAAGTGCGMAFAAWG